MFRKIFSRRKMDFVDMLEVYLQYTENTVPNFYGGVEAYLQNNLTEFEKFSNKLNIIEKNADDLLREINSHIYAYMIYPNMQKDISKLLNLLDDIIDTSKQVLLQMSIEKPVIPYCYNRHFFDLTALSGKTVCEVVAGIKSFFANKVLVEDHVEKVIFYEREVDQIEKTIISKTYSDKNIKSLSKKQHLCHFVKKVALPSDKAYKIAKVLLIYNMNIDSNDQEFRTFDSR